MVHSDVRRSPRTVAPASPSALGVNSPISKARKLGTPSRSTVSPSPVRRRAAEQLRSEKTPQQTLSPSSSTPRVGSAPNYKIPETLTVRLNVYDLVWNRNDTRCARAPGALPLRPVSTLPVAAASALCPGRHNAAEGRAQPALKSVCRAPASRCGACGLSLSGAAKNAASGFENLGFGLYHSALEIWGKEISFGHSKRYKSGVFAVKPRRAQVADSL
jgi:hypothetical protein